MNLSIVKKYCSSHGRLCLFMTLDISDSEIIVLGKARDKELLDSALNCEMHIQDFLQMLFYSQGDLYQSMGTRWRDTDWHSGHVDFGEGCSGFRNFLNEVLNAPQNNETWGGVSDEKIPMVRDGIIKFISGVVERYNNILSYNYETSITMEFPSESDDISRVKMPMITLSKDSLLVTPKGIYKLKAVRMRTSTLEELKDELTASIKRMYESRINMQISVFDKRIKDLERTADLVKAEAFSNGVMVADQLKEKWAIVDTSMVYRKTIVAKYIKHHNRIYNIPQEIVDEKKFFIGGLKIPIMGRPRSISCGESYHVNSMDDTGTVCMGDLDGFPLEKVLKRLPSSLETLNLDSAYGEDAYESACTLLADIRDEEKGGEVIWTKDE